MLTQEDKNDIICALEIAAEYYRKCAEEGSQRTYNEELAERAEKLAARLDR